MAEVKTAHVWTAPLTGLKLLRNTSVPNLLKKRKESGREGENKDSNGNHSQEPATPTADQTDARDRYIFDIDSQISSSSEGGSLIATTDSDNCVSIFSRSRLKLLKQFKGHSDIISGVKFGHTNSNLFYTSSHDGTVRCWDIRVKKSQPQQTFTGHRGSVLTSFDINCSDSLLCAGMELQGEDAYINFWDCRSTNLLATYKESHSDDITQVKFHPSNQDALATGSTDGLVCLFDISQQSEEDSLVTSLNSESSVSHLGWCGANNEYLYCQSHDYSLMVWDAIESTAVTKLNNVKHSLSENGVQIDYLVDCFYHSTLKTLVAVGGTHSGELRLLTLGRDALHPVATLTGGHTSTVRCLHWDNKTGSLLTGGEDSCICLWEKPEIATLSGDSKPSRKRVKDTLPTGKPNEGTERLSRKMQKMKIRQTPKPKPY